MFCTIYMLALDKENHGYGMKNVYKVIEKYNGHIELKWENGMFITSIEI